MWGNRPERTCVNEHLCRTTLGWVWANNVGNISSDGCYHEGTTRLQGESCAAMKITMLSSVACKVNSNMMASVTLRFRPLKKQDCLGIILVWLSSWCVLSGCWAAELHLYQRLCSSVWEVASRQLDRGCRHLYWDCITTGEYQRGSMCSLLSNVRRPLLTKSKYKITKNCVSRFRFLASV